MAATSLAPPDDLFDRKDEWDRLVRWAADPRPGLRVAVVWGRRRQGKSFLLRRLCDATGGLYYQAAEQATPQSLNELGARLGEHLGAGRLAFDDWGEALDAVGRLVPRPGGIGTASLGAASLGGPVPPRPAVAVLDEFPYLDVEAPELPSLIQRAVDRSLHERGPAVRLILCGSAVSVMAGLMDPRSPLHGRINLQLLVSPFDHRTASAFWGLTDPQLALRLFAVVGGTPAYRDLCRSRPASLAGFDRWVVDDVLHPTSALFRDDEVLFAEDVDIRTSRAIHRAILSAIAGGARNQSSIAAAVGRSVNALQHSLENLVRAQVVIKEEDVIRQKRPAYGVAEPLVRFHQAVRDPDAVRFEDGDGAAAWRDAQDRFRSAVLGPAWEDLVRVHVRRQGAELLGEPVKAVGRTGVPDPARRIEEDVDVVALGRGSGATRKVVRALGEAKLRALERGDLVRLEGIVRRLARPNVRVDEPRYILASASGFSDELMRERQRRSDVVLIGAGDVFAG